MDSLSFRGYSRGNAVYASRSAVVQVSNRTMAASVLTGDDATSFLDTARISGNKVPPALVREVAEAALLAAKSKTLSAAPSTGALRSYSVPNKVAATAASALRLDGLSPQSTIAATLLSSGTKLTAEDVRWVSSFFQNTDAETAGSTKWTAWGGNHGQLWSTSVAAKLGLDSVTAAVPSSALDVFTVGSEVSRAFWGRVVSHGKVDSVFRLDNGVWATWANNKWVSAAEPRNKIELDDAAALYACGALTDAPDSVVDLSVLSPDEWLLASAALHDTEFLDRLTAAGANDGDYTPEERSEDASSQLRDANGKFAKAGDQGLIKSLRMRGVIKDVSPDGKSLNVVGSDGKSYMLDPKDFEIDGGVGTAPGGANPTAVTKMPDFSKILGQPRASVNTPKAWMKNLLQPMGPAQMKQVAADYEGFITAERNRRAADFKGGTGWRESRPMTETEKSRRKKHRDNMKANIKTYEDFFKKYGSKKKSVTAAAENDADSSPDTDKPDGNPVLDPEGGPAGEINPDNSDVPPLYMALVDREDPRAVTEMVALVPANSESSTATAFKRVAGEWVPDPKVMQELRSATPPPTVLLEPGEELDSVLEQVDNEAPDEPEGDGSDPTDPTVAASGYQPVLTLAAAGGADRNRGGAEALRRYWTIGEGGMKIRWGTPGDWRRCVRQLTKHLGPRSKGYCALRHRETTGMWPGDKKNRKSFSLYPGGPTLTSQDEILRSAAVIRASALEAAMQSAVLRINGEAPYVPEPVSPEDIKDGRVGRAFMIPIVVPEGLSSGDKRHFRKGSLNLRTLPLPLMWQIQTGEGHNGAVIVGRIDYMERTAAGLGNAYGVFDTGAYAKEAQRLVENGMLRWVSVDLDKFEVDEDASERDPDGKMHIKKGRAMGATLVAKPAFQECTLELIPIEEEDSAVDNVVDISSSITASASISKSIPVEPPSSWFADPLLSGPTPIKVDDQGRVFGHIATWHTNHVGLANATPPPRSRSGYAYFHTGVVRTSEGSDVAVGQLTLAGGHASLDKDATAAAKHYDDTASALADVHAGEDAYGIWVAGALRPGTTPEQIRAFRASAPSGDWRFIPGSGLEMIAVCQVNVPGFPVPRASLAASAAPTEEPMALVAAGTADLIAMRSEDSASLEALAAAAQARLFNVLGEDGKLHEAKLFSADERKKLVESGAAMADGSFAVESAADLRRAVAEYASSTLGNRPAVRRHITSRARALGLGDQVPTVWREASMTDSQLANRVRLDTVVASARIRKVEELSTRMEAFELQNKVNDLSKSLGI